MPIDPIARMEVGLKLSQWVWAAGVLVALAVSALLATGHWMGQDRIRIEQLLFAAWTLGPPCWFVLQHRLWPPVTEGYERFRIHQSLLKAIWAGVLAFLAAIMFGRWG